MNEAQVTKQIISYLKGRKKAGDAICYLKVHGGPMQRAGEPDLHVTLDGKSYWIEIKSPTGAVTKLQNRRLDQWSDAGATTGVARSVNDVRRLLGDDGAGGNE